MHSVVCESNAERTHDEMAIVDKYDRDMTTQPISIAISTKDRRKDLSNLLDSLKKLNYPKENLEIVIVEEGDKPDPINDVKYIFIPRLNKGFSYTRNIAFQNCSHKLIAFVDDDCEVTPDWLNELSKHLKDDFSGVIGSVKVKNCNAIGWCENILGYPGGGLNAIDDAGNNIRPTESIVTCNALIKSEAIRSVGGFDESDNLRFGGEDAVLALYFNREKFKLIYNPSAVVYHKPKENMIAIFKWASRMGKGHTLLAKYIHGQSISLNIFRKLLTFKIILFIIGLFIFYNHSFYYTSIVLLIYFIKINSTYIFHRKYIKKWSIFLLLPIVKIVFDLGEDFGRIYALSYIRESR
ncbi:MAG: glycosyltransferase [Proteobacteria bacterium]|nr:glycosyltransferase [Pseudomonadota bacterium]